MNQIDWLFVVALTACLVLAVGAYRGQRIGAKKTLVMALVWGAIFLLLAAIFSAVRP